MIWLPGASPGLGLVPWLKGLSLGRTCPSIYAVFPGTVGARVRQRPVWVSKVWTGNCVDAPCCVCHDMEQDFPGSSSRVRPPRRFLESMLSRPADSGWGSDMTDGARFPGRDVRAYPFVSTISGFTCRTVPGALLTPSVNVYWPPPSLLRTVCRSLQRYAGLHARPARSRAAPLRPG